jgi:hypothetical protein
MSAPPRRPRQQVIVQASLSIALVRTPAKLNTIAEAATSRTPRRWAFRALVDAVMISGPNASLKPGPRLARAN